MILSYVQHIFMWKSAEVDRSIRVKETVCENSVMSKDCCNTLGTTVFFKFCACRYHLEIAELPGIPTSNHCPRS